MLRKHFEPDWRTAILLAVAGFGTEEVGMGAWKVVVAIETAFGLAVGIVGEPHLANAQTGHSEELPTAFAGDAVAGDKKDSLLQHMLVDSAFGVVH